MRPELLAFIALAVGLVACAAPQAVSECGCAAALEKAAADRACDGPNPPSDCPGC